MTTMSIVDHLYVLIIAVVQPITGYITFNRLVRRAEAGETINRNPLYNSTILTQWILFGVLVAVWSVPGRPWADLGFGLALDYRLLAGIVLTLLVMGFLAQQLRQLGAADSEAVEGMRCELGKLEIILPRNMSELRRFYAVSTTAGIVEETIWRGFMIWYLSHLMPIWAAAVVSTVGFGIAHAYQGAANVPKVILVGAVFTGLYLLTGSLWLPMILHAVFDIVQGRAVYGIIRSAAPAVESPSP